MSPVQFARLLGLANRQKIIGKAGYDRKWSKNRGKRANNVMDNKEQAAENIEKSVELTKKR
jgi:hypothetical protein